MLKFAEFMVKELNVKIPAGMGLKDISHGSDRYVLYKVGPVLSVSVSVTHLSPYWCFQYWCHLFEDQENLRKHTGTQEFSI